MNASRIVLIRAVNVGGTAKLPMAELRTMADELGATDVSTYIASGNLLCTPPDDAFDRRLQSAIEERFGFVRDVISRSREDMVAALAAHPFDVTDPKISYISFLASTPTRDAVARATRIETGEDRWRVIGREQHIRYAVSAGRPQMKTDAIARALSVAGTARNLLTVRKLIDLTG